MKKLAPLVLAAAMLTACGAPTVTTVPAEAPRVSSDAHSGGSLQAPEHAGPLGLVGPSAPQPVAVPGVGTAPGVHADVHPAPAAAPEPDTAPRVADASLTRKVSPQFRKVAAERKVTVERKVTTPPVVVPPVVAAPASSPAPVIDRYEREVADPPVVATSSQDEPTPGVPSVVISPAPVIDRGTRDVADPPVVVGDTTPVEPAADVVAVDDDGLTLMEKERSMAR